MLSKKSKIEELRKSRKGQVLVVSVAASLCRACTKVCDRFAAIRCGPSRCPAWDPPAGLKIFVRQPEKTFSTASVKLRSRAGRHRLPLYPSKQTSGGRPGKSVSCHIRTNAAQQTRCGRVSVNSSSAGAGKAKHFSCFLLPNSGEQCAEVAGCQLAVGLPRPVGQHEVIAK